MTSIQVTDKNPMTSTTSTVPETLNDNPSEGNILSVSNLSKFFERANGVQVPAVDDVSLSVRSGEFLVLLGPSGCGKTTLLRCIAGLELPDSGDIEIEGRTVYSSTERVEISARNRKLSMVFQSYALWPNMSVFDNIAYPLRNRKVKKAQIAEDVRQIAELVEIDEVIDQFPNHISGGQQQRVALARALVNGDALVLFDEPLSNVDAKVRKDLRIQLVALQRRFGFAAVYVTHDQEDAMELGNMIAVLEKGKVAQLASPREVYENPASRYVATFIGSTNELEGKVIAVDDGVTVETAIGTVRGMRVPEPLAVGDDAVAIFRPEDVTVSKVHPDNGVNLKAIYRQELFSGTHVEHILSVNHKVYRVWHGEALERGTEGWLDVSPSKIHIFKP